MDVLPDVELGPVRDRKNTDALPLGLSRVVKVPELRALVLRVPAVRCSPEREDPLLRAALFLIAARPAKRSVKAVVIERLLQPFRLPHVGMQGTMIERVDPALLRFGIMVDKQFHAALLRHPVTQLVHVLELPGRIDVKQRKRRRRGIKGLARKMQHHGRILADAVEHHWLLRLRNNLAHDMNALSLKPLKMCQNTRHFGSTDQYPDRRCLTGHDCSRPKWEGSR